MNKSKRSRKFVGARLKGIPVRRDTTVPLKKERGITLIALVITIVILLILAGVTLNIVFDEGLIGKSQTAVDTYSEQSARERLEIELVNMMGEKVTNKNYNNSGFLTSKLEDAGFIVNENIVIVDGWQFQIDRSVPKISLSLGKGEENKNIKIDVGEVAYSTDGTTATVKCTISYEGTITSIIICGKSLSVPEKVDGKYVVNLEYKENKTVGIMVKDENDNYALSNVKISELTEDMVIKTAEDLKTFRDMVNAGRTFEGRTVSVANDIDLNKNKYTVTDGTITFNSDAEQWVPIGTDTIQFAGTFDGNYHTIKGLYIYNNNRQNNGLFDTINEKGTVKNVILDYLSINNVKSGNIWIGGVAIVNHGTVERCQLKSNSNIWGQQTNKIYNVGVAGIVVFNYSNIKECVNNAKLGAWENREQQSALIGGIAATNFGSIEDCYNTGYIYNTSSGGAMIGGIVGWTDKNFEILNNFSIKNCYNVGDITCTGYKFFGHFASIIGDVRFNNLSIENVYFKNTMTNAYCVYASDSVLTKADTTGKTSVEDMKTKAFAENLGTAFTQDTGNINNGYPILKWQVGK